MTDADLEDLEDVEDVEQPQSKGETQRPDFHRMDEGLRQKLEGLVPEVVKRTFYAGLGAVFTTEEGIRKLANEFSLPKEVAGYLVQQAQSTKDDLFRILAAELRSFLENLNLNEEMQRLLTSLSFEIRTEIRFVPNESKLVKPQVKNKVTVRRKPREDGGEDAGEGPDSEESPEEGPPPAGTD